MMSVRCRAASVTTASWVVEKWASLDALRAHAASDHMKAYAAKTRDLIAERKVHVLTPA